MMNRNESCFLCSEFGWETLLMDTSMNRTKVTYAISGFDMSASHKLKPPLCYGWGINEEGTGDAQIMT